MTRILVSGPADRDLDAILVYLCAHGGSSVAARYGRKFEGAIGKLALFPMTGSPRRGRHRQIRQISVAPYIVFYEFDAASDLVRVIRVLHERRNISDAMLSAQPNRPVKPIL